MEREKLLLKREEQRRMQAWKIIDNRTRSFNDFMMWNKKNGTNKITKYPRRGIYYQKMINIFDEQLKMSDKLLYRISKLHITAIRGGPHRVEIKNGTLIREICG